MINLVNYSQVYKIIIEKIKNNNIIIFNFFCLSLLQFLNMFIPLIMIPLLILKLGVDLYGKVLIAQSVAALFSIVISYGFDIPAIKDIAVNRFSAKKISEIISAVFILKLFLWSICFFIFLILLHTIPLLANNKYLYLFSFCACFNELLFLRFYFIGIEEMKYITIVSCISRILFLILIFIFVLTPDDYIIVPILNGTGILISSLFSFYIIIFKNKIKLFFVSREILKKYVKSGFPLFLSQSSGEVRCQINTIIIGTVIGTIEVAHFYVCYRIISIANQVFANLTQVVYPKLSMFFRKKTMYKLCGGVLLISLIISLILCLFGSVILNIIGGKELVEALPILFILSPLIVIQALAHIMNVSLGALNKSKAIAESMIIGTGIYLFSSFTLVHLNIINIYSISLCLVLAGLAGVIIRIFEIKKVLKNVK